MNRWYERIEAGLDHARRDRESLPSWPQLAFLKIVVILLSVASPGLAQERLKTMPGYERYQRMNREMTNPMRLGSLTVTWKNEGKAFEYVEDSQHYRYDVTTHKAVAVGPAAK